MYSAGKVPFVWGAKGRNGGICAGSFRDPMLRCRTGAKARPLQANCDQSTQRRTAWKQDWDRIHKVIQNLILQKSDVK